MVDARKESPRTRRSEARIKGLGGRDHSDGNQGIAVVAEKREKTIAS